MTAHATPSPMPAAVHDGGKPGLTLTGISRQFGTFKAADGVALDVPDGAMVALLGPSGCGKTTTLRMIAGLETPDTGKIEVAGRAMFDSAARINIPAERRHIGMVFQSYAVWPHMTVAQNIAFPLRAQKIPRAEADELLATALRTVKLDQLSERYPSQLSGGQQQRIALARAIVFQPRLLLLDEPLSNLDATLREEMRSELRILQQRLGITAVFVTHDQAEALAISDRVAVMNGGRVVQYGDPRDIYERPANAFVAGFVGWKNLLEVTVVDTKTVRLGDVDLPVAVPAAMRTGQQAMLGLRPSDVRFAGADRAGMRGAVRATVESVLFMGDNLLCDYRIGPALLTGHAAPSDRLRIGDVIDVFIDPDRSLLMPA